MGDYTSASGSNDIILYRPGQVQLHCHRRASTRCSTRPSSGRRPTTLPTAAPHYGLGPDDAALIDWRRQNHRVVTGNDVWLGHNAVLMGGVTLGDGAVVGAGAVVTHDVAPYEIVGGVPARHIGWRYPPELIAAMERIRWWDWSHDMLRERLRDFDDAAAFCRKFDPQQKRGPVAFIQKATGPCIKRPAGID